MKTPTPDEINRVVAARFAAGDPRSTAYQEGFEMGLRLALGIAPKAPVDRRCPHTLGISDADAWLAGHIDGMQHARFAYPDAERRPTRIQPQ